MKIYPYVKRFLDIVFSLFFLIIFLPLFIMLYFLFLFFSGFPIFFVQKRVTMNGKIFKIYKFRTMVNNAIRLQKKGKTNDEVSTSIGRIIRPLHLDELLQLWNILKGDMSFVGYRPLATKDCNFKNKIFIKVHSIRAGLTGLNTALGYIDEKHRIQITKKNHLPKNSSYLLINKYYVEHMSFMLDMKIIWWTFLLELEHFEEEIEKS